VPYFILKLIILLSYFRAFWIIYPSKYQYIKGIIKMDICHSLFLPAGIAIVAGYSYKAMNNVAEATLKLNECIAELAKEILNQSDVNMTCDYLSDDLRDKNIGLYVAAGTCLFLLAAGSALCCIKPAR
jgi:hypothetical protein